MKDLKITYKSNIESQNIDMASLRPNKSYDFLLENRNASLNELLSDSAKLKEFLTKRNCPCCQYDKYTFSFTKDNLDIVKCEKCNVLYVNPIFNEEKYIQIYQSKQYQEIVQKLGEDSHLYRKNRFGKERMDFIEKYHRNELPKRFLDIGCSTGFVIEEAQERGWDTSGIELNPSAADFARKRGLKIFSKPLEGLSFENKFSAIGLFDVLEHLVNPNESLLKIRDMLLPNGNIFIYVPNYTSASREILGIENSHFIWPTHHLTYFTPDTLKNFIESLGFKVFFWETQGLDLYDIHWFFEQKSDIDTRFLEKYIETLQFYINCSGHGKNLRMFATKDW